MAYYFPYCLYEKRSVTLYHRIVFCGDLILCIHPSRSARRSKGNHKPYNAALHAYAVSDNDTGNAVIQSGAFEIKNLKGGRYRIIIEGLHPYKTTTKPDVIVNGGSATEVGEIALDQ